MRSTLVLLLLAALSPLFVSTTACAQETTRPELNHDPEKALITANDVRLFWSAYDLWLSREHGAPGKLAEVLQHEYLDKGSLGVKDFTPNRIVSAQHLADTILHRRSYYDNARRNTERMDTFVPKIRMAMLGLRKLYPEASFPAVYFVIGTGTSGGTSSRSALIIGSEMFGEGPPYPVPITDVVPMVIHELVHFQQRSNDATLLRAAMREGAADFISELVTGRHINEAHKAFGDSHEQKIWQRFQKDVASGAGIGSWMYDWDPKPDDAPPDLGYYMGYKICQSYYQIHADKQQALQDIIAMQSPEKILAESAYEKRFK
jgi:hypothetical protein